VVLRSPIHTYHATKGLECLSHLIYTVRPCLIQTCRAVCRVPAELRPCRSESDF
jgi:hypothetical protein